MAIVVVGSINLDLVTMVDSFPEPGATIAGRGFAMHAGGKGANQAVAAARLGAEVRMIGMLGGDAFACVLRGGLDREGVDHRGVGSVTGSSGIASITVNSVGPEHDRDRGGRQPGGDACVSCKPREAAGRCRACARSA